MLATAENRSSTFEQEALPHLDSLYSFALRLSGDSIQAEDLVQETMLKAYRSWHQYQSGTNVRAWLFTILRNNFVGVYRRRKHEKHSVEVKEIEATTVFDEVQEIDPEGRFFDGLVDDEVIRAIRALPIEYRDTLVLRDLEGLTYAEIAQVTGVPVGTVRSRLFRARQALQRQLYDYAVEMGYTQRRVA